MPTATLLLIASLYLPDNEFVRSQSVIRVQVPIEQCLAMNRQPLPGTEQALVRYEWVCDLEH